MDWIKFLNAQLDEDETLAKGAAEDSVWELPPALRIAKAVGLTGVPSVASHVFRHDPARVLREVEAKRVILALHAPYVLDEAPVHCKLDDRVWPCGTVRCLAAVYSDPDYED